MKRVLLLALVLLFLSGCSAESPASSAPVSPETSPAEAASPEAAEPITAESLRAEYEAEGFTVREIIPYEGDFLVYYGSEPYNGIFQWVYTETGLRAPLLFSGREILDYQIILPGQIRVLVGGSNVFNNAARAFPVYEYATACLPLNRAGIPLAQDSLGNGIVRQSIYWAPLDVSHTFGWGHGQVALVDVRIGANGIEAVFGPTADNLMGFFAAASGIPVTTPSYDEPSHTLTLRFRETALSSGERTEFTSENDQWAYEDLSSICQLPTFFPAGTITGSNDFISAAEIQEDGEDTLLVLTLTEAAQQYTAETGQLLQNESRPYLRLSLSEESSY